MSRPAKLQKILNQALKLSHQLRRNPKDRKSIAALSAEVELHIDEAGVPHLSASSERDLCFAQGYFSASERLFQMDLSRRAAFGELAAIFGRSHRLAPRLDLVDVDHALRQLAIRDVAVTSARSLEGEERDLCEAYVAGINAFIVQGPLPLEFQLLDYLPRPWDLADSAGVWQLFAFSHSRGWRAGLAAEVLRGSGGVSASPQSSVHATSGAGDGTGSKGASTKAGALGHSQRSGSAGGQRSGKLKNPATFNLLQVAAENAEIEEANTLPEFPHDQEVLAKSSGHLLELLETGLGRGVFAKGQLAQLSSLAVDREESSDGRPFVAGVFQIDTLAPSALQLFELQLSGWRAGGAAIPGVPGLVAGRNPAVAWAPSSSGIQDSEWVVESLDSEKGMAIRGGKQEAWDEESTLIEVRGEATQERILRFGPNGPLFSGALLGKDSVRVVEDERSSGPSNSKPSGSEMLSSDPSSSGNSGSSNSEPSSTKTTRITPPETSGTAPLSETPELGLGLRWTGHIPAPSLSALTALLRARDLQEMRDALATLGAPTLDFFWTAASGQVGVQRSGLVPRRSSTPPPGLRSANVKAHEWEGLELFESLPFLTGVEAMGNPAVAGIEVATPPRRPLIPGAASAEVKSSTAAPSKFEAFISDTGAEGLPTGKALEALAADSPLLDWVGSQLDQFLAQSRPTGAKRQLVAIASGHEEAGLEARSTAQWAVARALLRGYLHQLQGSPVLKTSTSIRLTPASLSGALNALNFDAPFLRPLATALEKVLVNLDSNPSLSSVLQGLSELGDRRGASSGDRGSDLPHDLQGDALRGPEDESQDEAQAQSQKDSREMSKRGVSSGEEELDSASSTDSEQLIRAIRSLALEEPLWLLEQVKAKQVSEGSVPAETEPWLKFLDAAVSMALRDIRRSCGTRPKGWSLERLAPPALVHPLSDLPSQPWLGALLNFGTSAEFDLLPTPAPSLLMGQSLEPSPGGSTSSQLSTGQSGDPLSPHYRDHYLEGRKGRLAN